MWESRLSTRAGCINYKNLYIHIFLQKRTNYMLLSWKVTPLSKWSRHYHKTYFQNGYLLLAEESPTYSHSHLKSCFVNILTRNWWRCPGKIVFPLLLSKAHASNLNRHPITKIPCSFGTRNWVFRETQISSTLNEILASINLTKYPSRLQRKYLQTWFPPVHSSAPNCFIQRNVRCLRWENMRP